MDSDNSRSFYTSKLVFLGILVAAVAAVWSYSTRHTALEMTPASVLCGELSVSMPGGLYWESPSKGVWTWQPNAYGLSAIHMPAKDCSVEVRYQLSPITVEPEQYLAAAAGAWHLDIVNRGKASIGDKPLFWAALAEGDGHPAIFYAVAALNPQRMLSVRVAAKAGAPGLAAQVFDEVLKSLKYTDSGLTQKGAELVKAVENGGIAQLAVTLPSDVFVVKNTSGAETGFLISKTGASEKAQEAVLESLIYSGSSNNDLRRTRFTTTDMVGFAQQTWVPGNATPLATVKVEESVLMSKVVNHPRQEFYLSDAAIADQLAEVAGWQLLKSGTPEAIIDIVTFDGSVQPVRVTPGKAPAEGDAWKSSAVFKSAAGQGLSSEIFYDANGVAIKHVQSNGETLTTERTTSEHLKEAFPSLGDAIERFVSGSSGGSIREKEIDYGRKPI
jgi:hypothetical protein